MKDDQEKDPTVNDNQPVTPTPDDHPTVTGAAQREDAVVIDSSGRLVGNNPSEPEQLQALPSQAPGRADYQRAAALMLHQYRQDTLGWNDVMADADQEQRLSALVMAIVEIAGQAPDPLSSPRGMAALQAVATGMAVDDTIPDQ